MTEFYEKKTVTLRLGTLQLIKEYREQHKDRWDNDSHFIRCALEREFRRLRTEPLPKERM